MIAPIKNAPQSPEWHLEFLAMLPAITRCARKAFGHLSPEARENCVENVIAHAVVAFKALYDQGRVELAYPSVLAMHGIKRVKCGRTVGTQLNVRDVSSLYCQLSKKVNVERLDRFDPADNSWKEVIVEDRHAGPAEIAASRIDINSWLQALPHRDRRLATTLAAGETTGETARRFDISAARVSQLRRQLMKSWQTFVGEEDGGKLRCAAVS